MKRFAKIALGALLLAGTATVAAAPADARVVVGFGVGPAYYGPSYYGPGYCNPYYYNCGYYGPGHYGYAPAIHFGFGGYRGGLRDRDDFRDRDGFRGGAGFHGGGHR